ncbi:hypothetical protein N0V90_011665 [Kalmusia sp. IMI 367209]|nr:hypothetical protein N0V90_011665 [Kalmusia sp. IMI 367209]
MKYRKVKGREGIGAEFWCDACVETGIEQDIAWRIIDSLEAEKRRMRLRESCTRRNWKQQSKARKCYIGAKSVAVPVDRRGNLFLHYKTGTSKHPFDCVVPYVGANMFEDLVPYPEAVHPVEEKQDSDADKVVMEKSAIVEEAEEEEQMPASPTPQASRIVRSLRSLGPTLVAYLLPWRRLPSAAKARASMRAGSLKSLHRSKKASVNTENIGGNTEKGGEAQKIQKQAPVRSSRKRRLENMSEERPRKRVSAQAARYVITSSSEDEDDVAMARRPRSKRTRSG